MTSKVTTVCKLNAALRKEGFPVFGDSWRSNEHIRAETEDGHEWYPAYASWEIKGHDVHLEALERWSEPKVELSTHVSAEQMPTVARAIAETHKSAKHKIGIQLICSPSVAVAISKALRGDEDDQR